MSLINFCTKTIKMRLPPRVFTEESLKTYIDTNDYNFLLTRSCPWCASIMGYHILRVTNYFAHNWESHHRNCILWDDKLPPREYIPYSAFAKFLSSFTNRYLQDCFLEGFQK